MRTKAKRVLKWTTFIGFCPFCRGICSGTELDGLKIPLTKNRVDCPKCGRRFKATKLKQPDPRRKRTRLFGFRRTSWKKLEFDRALGLMKDALNLFELRGEAGIEKAKLRLTKEGWSDRQLWVLAQLAAQRSVWNDPKYIIARWGFEHYEKPAPIVREGWRK